MEVLRDNGYGYGYGNGKSESPFTHSLPAEIEARAWRF
jgi:hypothetical protein